MSLTNEIQKAIIAAMKAKDKETLSVLRMTKAAISNKQIALGHELSDDETLAVLASEVKSRNESIVDFKKGNRPDLVEKTENEINVLTQYLPAQLTETELDTLVSETIQKLSASGLKDMGKVMGVLSSKTKGRADGSKVAALVKAKLGAQ